MADIDPTIAQQVLNILKRERKETVQHYSHTDDLGLCFKVMERLQPTLPVSTRFPLTIPFALIFLAIYDFSRYHCLNKLKQFNEDLKNGQYGWGRIYVRFNGMPCI